MPHKPLDQKLDIECGFLVKSPCRECDSYSRFPECLAPCPLIDRVQTALTSILPTGRNPSDLESYSILYD